VPSGKNGRWQVTKEHHFFHSATTAFPTFWTSLPLRAPLLTRWMAAERRGASQRSKMPDIVRQAMESPVRDNSAGRAHSDSSSKPPICTTGKQTRLPRGGPTATLLSEARRTQRPGKALHRSASERPAHCASHAIAHAKVMRRCCRRFACVFASRQQCSCRPPGQRVCFPVGR